jgi:hypothetical protein
VGCAEPEAKENHANDTRISNASEELQPQSDGTPLRLGVRA